MAQTIDEALNAAILYSDDFLYRFVSLPPNAILVAASVVAEAANPFIALLVDKDEVTLMLEEEDYEEYKKRFLGHKVSESRYRLITFDVELEPTLIGFMAKISAALAAAQITIMPFAAFSRDHLFVQESDFEKAMAVLEGLKELMEINIFNDPNKVPKPKNEVKIEELKAEPYPDGFRVKVTVRLTPFRERPNMFLLLKQADGTFINDLSIIETMHYDSDYVIHIKRKGNPAGDYVLEAELFYETRQPPQDRANIAFSIPNHEEN